MQFIRQFNLYCAVLSLRLNTITCRNPTITKGFVLGFLFFALGNILQASAQENASISRFDEEKIDSLALEKVKDLGEYISVIGNKSTSFSEANRVIERALELFVVDSRIGVSSKKTEKIVQFAIRDYFERLMALNYDKVSIEWFDVHFISDLELISNGVYVGVITIYQRFQGSKGDRIIYKDVTKKDITVFMKKKAIIVEGKEKDFWDILLGDILVAETY